MYELKNGKLVLQAETPPIFWQPMSPLEVLDPWTREWKPLPFITSHGGQFILGDVATFDLSGIQVREVRDVSTACSGPAT